MKSICFQMSRKAWLALAMVLCLSFPALAQKITVQGTVVDPTDEPLIGASVLVKGTSQGVATDIDGNFRLEVAPNATLVVSYVGYNTQEVEVGGRTNITVTLSENSVVLGEVVAIGYGVVKKSDATGSVAMVKPDDIEAGMATSAQDLLVGASPGVVVTSQGGNPQGNATIRIRGGSSLSANNNPLIVLDGVPLSDDNVTGGSNPLAMISPENIESMTILKDASATAIYGSRASNGVIIITTKKGQAGRPQVNFSANLYVNTARKKQQVLSADELRQVVYNQFGPESTQAGMLSTYDTNWQDEILRTAISHDYSLSVGGSAGFLPYRVSATYTNNQGIVKKSSMERVTVGFNLNPKFFNGKLSINANARGYYIRNDWTGDAGMVASAIGMNPTLPIMTNSLPTTNSAFPYLYNGYLPQNIGEGLILQANGTVNPIAVLNSQSKIANILRSNGNFQVDYALHFLPDLHLNLNLGYDVQKGEQTDRIFQNSVLAWNSYRHNGAGVYNYNYGLMRNTLLDFYANYRKEFAAIQSNLDVMAGYSWQYFYSRSRGNGSIFETPGYYPPVLNDSGSYDVLVNPETLALVGTADGGSTWGLNHLQLVSFFGRLNYTFKDTYLLTFTLRDDGTSRFSKDNRWGLFPSVALGWKISNMPFMESAQDVMNEWKLRLGWGITGQQDLGGDYFPYIPLIVATTSDGTFGNGSQYPNMYNGQYYDANGNIVSNTYYPGGYNPSLKWEETTTWNVGFDFGFLNNRITAALDWYLRNSRDLLAFVAVPAGSLTTNMFNQNIGDLRNVGVEATITAKPVVTNDFTWTTSYNIGWNDNKITKLNGESGFLNVGASVGATGTTIQRHQEGYPASSFCLYEQVYDADGKPIEGCFVDQNGDGQINDEDLVISHSPAPKVTMTLNNNFNWKNWDLGFSLRANIGNYVYNNVEKGRTDLVNMASYGIDNLIVAPYYFTTAVTNGYRSNYFLKNAGFVRCDNITLGYTFPSLLNNNLRLRLFAACQNPFVITKYNGLDPEVDGGIDSSVYPRPVTFTLGLVATF